MEEENTKVTLALFFGSMLLPPLVLTLFAYFMTLKG